MKFYTSNSTGDAGLFYLGYWINHNFRYPFRVLAADIGIDAEIEIINSTFHSEGLIVKAQVKSTKTEITKNFVEYIEERHLMYWNKLTVPVIYFKVDLISKEIYYKVISSFDDIEEAKEGKESRWKINFDIVKDKLTINTKDEWIEKFKVVEFHNTHIYFHKINDILNDVNPYVMDSIAYARQDEKLKEVKRLRDKLESIKSLYPWKFGKNLVKKLEDIDTRARNLRNELEISIKHANY